MVTSQTVDPPLFIPMEDYIAIYSKHTTTVTAATNLKHIAPCNGKTYQTLSVCFQRGADLDIRCSARESNNLMQRG